jgi:hypothetical protein
MLVIKRRLGKTVETFEIPEDQLEQYKTVSVSSGELSLNREAIDLYKMEYEKCAKRYEDLYTAAWTNFYYMALIAGAILTFGSDRLPIVLSAFVACLPLLFWWLASFEKLDRYGDGVLQRLVWLEKILNRLTDLESYPADKPSAVDNIPKVHKGLCHYQRFAEKSTSIEPGVTWFRRFMTAMVFVDVLFIPLIGLGLVGQSVVRYLVVFPIIIGLWLLTEHWLGTLQTGLKHMSRVRFAVRLTGLVVLMTAICFGWKSIKLYQDGELFKEVSTVPRKN